MEVGEATSKFLTLSSDSTGTVTVPSGETWKFTTIGASTNNIIAYNDQIAVGVTNGNKSRILVESQSQNTVPVGTASNVGNSIKSLTIDGDNQDLYVRNNDTTTHDIYWTAIRIS